MLYRYISEFDIVSLGCNFIKSRAFWAVMPTFQVTILPPSSGSMNKPSKCCVPHMDVYVGPEGEHSSEIAAVKQRLKKLADVRIFPEASVEFRSSFASCVSCFS
jgi:hypothetical protein